MYRYITYMAHIYVNHGFACPPVLVKVLELRDLFVYGFDPFTLEETETTE